MTLKGQRSRSQNLNRLITLKQFIVGTKFALVTYRKSYLGFQLVVSPLMLDDLERSNSRSQIKSTLKLWILRHIACIGHIEESVFAFIWLYERWPCMPPSSCIVYMCWSLEQNYWTDKVYKWYPRPASYATLVALVLSFWFNKEGEGVFSSEVDLITECKT